jgi:Na+-driven multidrug efflux pump
VFTWPGLGNLANALEFASSATHFAYLLGFYWQWGAVGLWIGQYLGGQVAAITYYLRFQQSISKLQFTTKLS